MRKGFCSPTRAVAADHPTPIHRRRARPPESGRVWSVPVCWLRGHAAGLICSCSRAVCTATRWFPGQLTFDRRPGFESRRAHLIATDMEHFGRRRRDPRTDSSPSSAVHASKRLRRTPGSLPIVAATDQRPRGTAVELRSARRPGAQPTQPALLCAAMKAGQLYAPRAALSFSSCALIASRAACHCASPHSRSS